jgi:NAD(P)-dependent dehydrogenase (short-subunit alcohol dehydrogenase family)
MARDTFEPAKDIPNLKGKVVLVTGGNAGIGKATIRAIAIHDPARIYLCARRRSAAETAAAELRAESRYNRIDILDLDLASLDSVKKCAAEFTERENRLDLLFLNAGVASTAPDARRLRVSVWG